MNTVDQYRKTDQLKSRLEVLRGQIIVMRIKENLRRIKQSIFQRYQPKISILIAVYNVENCLREAMDSAVNQTMRDIEIICVDDGSSDGSPQILREYQERDSRIHIITHENNRSLSIVRKSGIEAASGEYLLCLDADDQLYPDACELLYSRIRAEGVEILHFNMNLDYRGYVSLERLNSAHEYLKPYHGRLFGRQIVLEGYQNGSYDNQMINKLMDMRLCKKAYRDLKLSIYRGEDRLGYFYIAYYAKSYLGVPEITAYNYCYGAGGGGKSAHSLSFFKESCRASEIVNEIKEFLQKKDINKECGKITETIKAQYMSSCWNMMISTVSLSERGQAFDLLIQYWNRKELLCQMEKRFRDNPEKLLEHIRDASALCSKEREVKNIGLCTYSTSGQTALKRIAWLGRSLKQEDGIVIFCSDEGCHLDTVGKQSDEILAELPAYRIGEGYEKRAEALYYLIHNRQIDMMLLFDCTNPAVIWDMLLLKLYGIPVVLYAGPEWINPLRNVQVLFSKITCAARIADAVLCSGFMEQAYFSNHNSNVHLVLPFWDRKMTRQTASEHFDIRNTAGKTPRLFWSGSFTKEEQGEHAILAFLSVLDVYEQAVLVMAGEGEAHSEWRKNQLIEMTIELGIQNKVLFTDSPEAKKEQLDQSTICLVTSRRETDPQAMLEALANGLPVVMYGEPWFTLPGEGSGIRSVTKDRYTEMAEEVIRLLCDEKEYWEAVRYATESVSLLKEVTPGNQWDHIMKSIFHSPAQRSSEAETNIWELFLENYRFDTIEKYRKIEQLKKRVEQLEKEAEISYGS